ncbi:MAG: hypothetical protein JXP73_06865 [Deltaproteobacteria bacterium]|jgi:hypothetical protein|nr:hypothetical protein [Deltaproteobacteria bacterium]
MMENEDSVVTSLNELRKLKHERITRQTQSRAVVGAGRAAALAVDPASDQMTPPPTLVPSLAPSRQVPLASVPAASRPAGFAGMGDFAGGPSAYGMAPVAPPVIQTKTSYKAAVFVTALLLGAGGVGYMKLQSDTQLLLAAKDAAIKRIEEERLQAVGLAAKAEAQSRNNLRQCEDKLKAALAAVPAVAPPSAPVVESKPEKPAPKLAARSVRSRSSGRAARRARAEPAAPKSADVPTIARKKRLDNDPLAGLGKL